MTTPNRYHRQALLEGIGEQGQARLTQASVLIVGVGALGTVSAELLARAGVGRITLADRDVVEATNLQRQLLYTQADADASLPKAVAAQQRLAAINPQITITAAVEDVHAGNVERLAGLKDRQPVDLLIDGTDNLETRYLLNDVAVKHAIPYAYAGAVGYTGLAWTILPTTPQGHTPWEKQGGPTPDLRAVFPDAPAPGVLPTCDTAGVLGPASAMIASYQAGEAIKALTGQWQRVARTMLSIDLQHNHVRQIALGPCDSVCVNEQRFDYLDQAAGEATLSLCGRDAVQVRPAHAAAVDLPGLAARFERIGAVTLNPFMLRATLPTADRAAELSVFKDGRAIVHGTTDPAIARTVVAKYVGV